MKTVGFSYGWAEGKLHSSKFRKVLDSDNYQATDDLSKADIIIAHSGGIFLLPKKMKAQKVLLVGVPYWPERSPLYSLFLKITIGLSHPKPVLQRCYKTLLNVIYLFNFPHQSKIQKMFYKNGYPKLSTDVVAVRYSKDPFMHPDKAKELAKNMGWDYSELDGQHDDLWLMPEPVISLLEQ